MIPRNLILRMTIASLGWDCICKNSWFAQRPFISSREPLNIFTEFIFDLANSDKNPIFAP